MSSFKPVPPRHNLSSSNPLPAALPAGLMEASFVFVRRDCHRAPLSAAYDGPYKVLRKSLHFFVLQLGERTDSVSVHRLKPAALPADAAPAVPPQCGRPRKVRPPAVNVTPAVQRPVRRVRFTLPAAKSRPARNRTPPDRFVP